MTMKLLIADDHTLFREALAQYILRAINDSEIRTACDVHEMMTLLDEDPNVDLVMLDVRMPGMNGLQGLEKLKSTYPKINVALLSGTVEEAEVERALEKGASGYLPKTMPGKVMVKGITALVGGERFVFKNQNTDDPAPSYLSDKGANQNALSSKAVNINLTPREKDVLALLAHGSSNKKIAEDLGLQVVTIKLHVRSICSKLGVHNRTQAALFARDNGLI